jgi:hypothetical protein
MNGGGLRVLALLAAVGMGVGAWGGGDAAAQDQPAPKRPTRGAPPQPRAPQPAPQPQPRAPSQAPDPNAKPGAQPVAKPKKDAPLPPPTVGPYVKQEQSKDLTLSLMVRVHLDNSTMKTTYRDPFDGRTVELPNITPMKYTTIQFVFPVVPSTASSDLYYNEIKGTLRINGREVDTSPEFLEGYPGPVKLTRWDAVADTGDEARQVQLDMNVGMRSYNTVFDEQAAMSVIFPKTYPPEVAALLKPQLYVELGIDAAGHVRAYYDTLVKDTLSRWLQEEGISDPKSVPPVSLAKTIAGKVWTEIQLSGDGLISMRTGELSGMEILPPAKTLELKRGSEQDVTALMAALYRKAGLPTRTVVGFDVTSKDGKFLQKSNKNNRLRSWVEFALYDEPNNTLNWVPVDVARMRKVTNRPPTPERPWKYFGTHDELANVTPFAMHFHPPTDVVAYGSPGFWGWFVTPAPAKNAEQALRFTATLSSKKGGEQEKDPKDPEKNPRPEKKKKLGG